MKNKYLFIVSLLIGTVALAFELSAQQQGNPQPAQRFQPPRGPGINYSRNPAQELSSVPLAKDDFEKKVLEVLDDMDKNQRAGSLSVPRDDGRLLRLLVESINAKNAVEIGTSIGYSGIWICLGLQKTGGHLTTFDIDPQKVARATENFKRAGLDKYVTIIEGDAHQKVLELKQPIDFLFLDADKDGYIDYLNKLLPLVKPGGLIVAHNMTRGQADQRFVDAITKNPELETIFIDIRNSGISISLKKR